MCTLGGEAGLILEGGVGKAFAILKKVDIRERY